ncbi:ABC transporter permease [Cohnella sp. CIP 111063]|nr:ABC transporter permease [Cohnella sp. CIP 111063]PRX74997.1 putative ABC transport system permease protein [Cohnella sp. SGD-V74]
MLMRMLRKDWLRNKSISAALLVFISLSALLASSGANMIAELSSSLGALFAKSGVPHYVQMHAGEVDRAAIDRWAQGNELVRRHQAAEMIKVEDAHLVLGDGAAPGSGGIMDHYFVKQNRSFDLLLDLDSQPVQVKRGEIAVPVYYKQRDGLEIGDKIRIAAPGFAMELRIADFVRDAQMNPSIIHSKRFVVYDADFARLSGSGAGEREYLLEFQLTDPGKLGEFRTAYEASNLPKLGPAIDHTLFRTLNALTDGLLAAVILLVSFLIGTIALLCLRFTILAAIEEDYREIGVMKAIGISSKHIRKLYLAKYVLTAAVASVIGYAASLLLHPLFTRNIMLYIGKAPKGLVLQLVPVAAAAFTFAIVIAFCMLTLRRFDRISAVEALRSGAAGEGRPPGTKPALHRNRTLSVPVFLAVKDIVGRFKMYRMLLLVFIISSFIMLVPVNFFHTVQSPGFNNYMGIERSDLRIDLQHAGSAGDDYRSIVAQLENDNDVEKYAAVLVSSFKTVGDDGTLENMTVEVGDFAAFPLEYMQGSAPSRADEIALSYLNGKEMEKKVGDPVRLIVDGREITLKVSGIYQDVTNGGRTAKAALPVRLDTVLRYEIAVDLKPGADVADKRDRYAQAMHPAKVTDLAGYMAQTFGNTLEQLKLVTRVATVVALLVSALITALFVKMAVAKDAGQIAIMKSIGFSMLHVRIQYVTKALLVLVAGIAVGTVLSNTAGPSAAGVAMSFMGAARIKFAIDPLQAYVLYPALLLAAVTVTALVSLASIRKVKMSEMNAT